ncbi:MAG TPA: YbjN domain-containing protein [Intrasporangiaceae bacterium]|nr:YbjN domain-containing protein [Intrasporangiaceae bacterium]
MSDPTALPNFPPPPDEHPLRGLVLDALQDLGLEPNVDADGDVAFKANDQQMFVRCLEKEVRIMRVFGQWKLADPVPQDKIMQLSVCNDINLSMTMVKAGLGNDALVVTSEHIVTSDEAVKQLLGVSVQITLATVQSFHERIVKLAEHIAEQKRQQQNPEQQQNKENDSE